MRAGRRRWRRRRQIGWRHWRPPRRRKLPPSCLRPRRRVPAWRPTSPAVPPAAALPAPTPLTVSSPALPPAMPAPAATSSRLVLHAKSGGWVQIREKQGQGAAEPRDAARRDLAGADEAAIAADDQQCRGDGAAGGRRGRPRPGPRRHDAAGHAARYRRGESRGCGQDREASLDDHAPRPSRRSPHSRSCPDELSRLSADRPPQVPHDPCGQRAGGGRRAGDRADHDQHADHGRGGDGGANPPGGEGGGGHRPRVLSRPGKLTGAEGDRGAGARAGGGRHPLPLQAGDRGGAERGGLPAHQSGQYRQCRAGARSHPCGAGPQLLHAHRGECRQPGAAFAGEIWRAQSGRAGGERAGARQDPAGQRLPRVQDQREGV